MQWLFSGVTHARTNCNCRILSLKSARGRLSRWVSGLKIESYAYNRKCAEHPIGKFNCIINTFFLSSDSAFLAFFLFYVLRLHDKRFCMALNDSFLLFLLLCPEWMGELKRDRRAYSTSRILNTLLLRCQSCASIHIHSQTPHLIKESQIYLLLNAFRI